MRAPPGRVPDDPRRGRGTARPVRRAARPSLTDERSVRGLNYEARSYSHESDYENTAVFESGVTTETTTDPRERRFVPALAAAASCAPRPPRAPLTPRALLPACSSLPRLRPLLAPPRFGVNLAVLLLLLPPPPRARPRAPRPPSPIL